MLRHLDRAGNGIVFATEVGGVPMMSAEFDWVVDSIDIFDACARQRFLAVCAGGRVGLESIT